MGVFGFALIGGFCLNFMPCVLPVIGLKIMSFMQEGDGAPSDSFVESLLRIRHHGCDDVLGAATVIAKNSGESLSWGEHFGDPRFRLAILVLIFSMALSFLGIWRFQSRALPCRRHRFPDEPRGPDRRLLQGCTHTILATPCYRSFF